MVIMIIKKYQQSDCAETFKLFYNTIHTVNAKDYTAEQLDAWVNQSMSMLDWNKSLEKNYCVISIANGIITGFGDIENIGKVSYLNRLYVHKDYQGMGFGNALCDTLEKSTQGKIAVHSSITAKPFFEKRGYKVIKEQKVERLGVFLINYMMEKV